MDMKQMVAGAQGQPQAGGLDSKMMLDRMTQMRGMLDEMIAMMGAEGEQAGFESVDKEGY